MMNTDYYISHDQRFSAPLFIIRYCNVGMQANQLTNYQRFKALLFIQPSTNIPGRKSNYLTKFRYIHIIISIQVYIYSNIYISVQLDVHLRNIF